MNVGDRVCGKDDKRYGTIMRTKFPVGGRIWEYGVLCDGDRVDTMWGYNESELLPVEVTVVEGRAVRMVSLDWAIATDKRLPVTIGSLGNYADLTEGSTVRITIERVRERG